MSNSPLEQSRLRAGLVLAGFLALPFAVFAHVAPFVSGRTLGSDYMLYSVPQQLLLQFSLANGSFPLYLPGFAGGLPAVAATQGQLFHPLPHLAALLPGYWDGHAFDLFTVLNLLSLGFAQWACWRLLRELAVDAVLAFVVSFVTVFNLRMLALFDYGASLQSWTATILLCVALARVVLHGPDVVRCACVSLATYLLLCSGHPQMAYLGFGGAILTLGCMTLLLPVLAPAGPRRPRGPALAACAASLVAGILLSSAYLLPFVVDFLPGAAQRTGQDFSWVYTPFGTHSATSLLHSVFRPFSSDVQGSFAGPALLAVPLLLPVLVAVRRPPLAVLATWTAALLVLALALAETLPLYFLAWKLVPMFAAFRAPGRVTMMAPFLLLLVLAWLCRAARVPLCLGGRTFDVAPLALVALAAAAVYAAYALVSTPQLDALELAPPARIAEIPPIVVRGVWLLGIASLVALAAYAQRPGRAAAALLVVLVLAQTTLVLRFGTWLTDARPSTTWSELVRRHRLRVGFSRGDPGAGMTPAILLERRKALGSVNQPTPLARLFRDVRPVGSRDEAFAILRAREPNVATLEGISMPVVPPGAAGTQADGYVRLLHASFNRFVLGVRTPEPALLAFGQPYARNWRAVVDGAERPVGVANGAFVGVAVPAGETVVELRYDSRAARAGMWLAIVTAWAIALAVVARVGRRGSGRGARVIAAVAVTVLLAGGLLAWGRSLYAGRHLGTSFEWRTPGWGGAPPSRERAPAP